MNELRIKVDAPENKFKLMVLGDMHIGDECCDLDMIKDTIDYVKEHKDCYVICNGDLINNALKTSKSDSYKEQMSIAEEQDLLIDLLMPIKDRILVMAEGNHEHRTSLLAGVSPLKTVSYALGIRDKFVENSYILDIEFGNYHNNVDRPNHYIVFGIHGGTGGGHKPGATANALHDMAITCPNCDLYVHSHTHTEVSYFDSVLLFDSKMHGVKEHQRVFYNANSFLKWGGYAEQKGYKPENRRPCVLVVRQERRQGKTKEENFVVTDIVRI